MNNSVRKDYDVIIVGAGLAGCAAATFLSQRELSVLLLDKAGFPRDKVCGDGFSGPSLVMLRRMGVLDKIKQIDPWNIEHVTLSSPAGTVLRTHAPYIDKDICGGMVIPRETLDHLLLDHVKELPHVQVMENTTVKDLVPEDNRVGGVIAQHNGQSETLTETFTETFKGKYIIAADGAYSFIAKKLGLFNNNSKHRAFAIRAYFENTANMGDAIELHYDPALTPGYGWLFPTGKNSLNAGVIVFNRYKDHNNIKELFHSFIRNNPHAKKYLDNACMKEHSLKGWPLTYGSFSSPRAKQNVLLTGDAASLIDPLTGEGILYALKSGEFAAEFIGNGILNNLPPKMIAHQYDRRLKKAFKWKEFMPGYLFQSMFNIKWLLNLGIKRAAKNPKKAKILASVIGHSLPKSRLFFNF